MPDTGGDTKPVANDAPTFNSKDNQTDSSKTNDDAKPKYTQEELETKSIDDLRNILAGMKPDPSGNSEANKPFVTSVFDTKDEIIGGILSGKGITQRPAMQDRTVANLKQGLDAMQISYPSNSTKQQLLDIINEHHIGD